MTASLAPKITRLPQNPTAQDIYVKVYAGTKPPIPKHGPGIRYRAQRRCTPIAETMPSRSGWATEFCICGARREVRVEPRTGQKTRWRREKTPVAR